MIIVTTSLKPHNGHWRAAYRRRSARGEIKPPPATTPEPALIIRANRKRRPGPVRPRG
jgi:hypothetical protein